MTDWLERWRTIYDAERAQGEQYPAPEPGASGDCWVGQAARFAAAERRVPQPDPFMRFVSPNLRQTDTVLDVGAGSGRHTAYLAGLVRQVLALEPSAAMRAQLEQRVAGLENVTVSAAGWPAAVPAADAIVCSHVVYGIREIGPFLQALYEHAPRCWLLVGLQAPSAALNPFWQRVRGVERLPLPDALICLNACHQLGIPAQLNLVAASRYGFADPEEALADIRWRLRLPAAPETDTAIRAAIDALLVPDADGRLIAPGQPAQTGVVWWQR